MIAPTSRTRLPTLLAFVVLAGSTVAMLHRRFAATALPRYGQAPRFRFTDQSGASFGTTELDGCAWVADFIFTSCPEICPRMTEEMARLQTFVHDRGLDRRVRLVSISIDPRHDTPTRLGEYAARFRVDSAIWKLLGSGSPEVVEAVARDFNIGVSRPDASPNAMPTAIQDGFALVHGTRFVLVDQHGTLRGYYDAGAGLAMARLRRDLQTLADGDRCQR
jgi:protein SCO1/2